MLVSVKCPAVWALLCICLFWSSPTLAVREQPLVQESRGAGHLLLCPVECSCDTLSLHRAIIDCRQRGLTNVPTLLPNATFKLFLDSNALQAFANAGPIPNLEVVTLSHNALSLLPSDAFRSSPRLRYLDLSANRLSNQLPDDVFHGLANLQYLNLSRNSLEHISNLQFQGLGSLNSLDLSHNSLSQLDRDAFQEISNLHTLDLSQNRLTHLQQEWFHQLGNLNKLVLSHNQIQRVSNTVFWSLNSLKNLDLSHNVISRVGRLGFKGLSEVIRLDLSHNNITILQESTTRTTQMLSEVDLSHNPLVSFDAAFQSSPSVQSLRLDHTERLIELTAASLQGLTGLTSLHLSHSALARLHAKAFADLVSLQELHLSRSQLRTLPKGLFNSFQILDKVHLQGNPWHCDCLLHWLLKWVGDHKGLMVAPLDTLCQTPETLHGSPILDALDHHMTCINASAEPVKFSNDFLLGSDALLSCTVDGHPKPSLTWLTPRNVMLHLTDNTSSITTHPSIHGPDGQDLQRFELFNNGSLKVKHIGRSDSGIYRCMASNALSNSTGKVFLTLNVEFIQDIKLMSIWVGLFTSGCFLVLTLVGQFVSWVMGRCGWECPCCSHLGSRKGQQLWRMLENMETYKSQQLDRLRDNYNNQAQRIKENCMQQMEWLRESYSCQVERLRDIRDYGTQQIDKIRDNYYSQVQKVRDYSASQIDRLRENYVFQRTRIRKFSTHQLLKLRENYKLQQQHLNKILESLNLDSCKANCSRTDSIIFETPELAIEPTFDNPVDVDLVHLHLDYADTGSQVSAYFTPNDSGSETSSSISVKKLQWEPGLLGTPSRKKRLRHPIVIKRDIGCSTTDLHLINSAPVHNFVKRDAVLLDKPEEEEAASHATDLDTASSSTPQLVQESLPTEKDHHTDEDAVVEVVSDNEHHRSRPPKTSNCTLSQPISEYKNSSNEDLNQLQSVECHVGVTIPPLENITETIV